MVLILKIYKKIRGFFMEYPENPLIPTVLVGRLMPI